MTMAMYLPSLLRATESGWPGSAISATSARVAMSTTASLPLGLVKLADVFTATSACAPSTVTEVGSPPMARAPSARGALTSAMSTKPISPLGLLL